MAILRHDAATRRRDRCGAGMGKFGVADEVAAFRGREQPGQHHAEFALPVAFDAGQSDDFAGAYFEGEIVEPRGAMAIPHGKPVADQRESRIGGRRGRRARRIGVSRVGQRHVERLHLPPHHRLHQSPHVGGLHVRRGDQPAGAQHGHPVGHLGDLRQLVGHQDHRASRIGHASADVEQGADLARRQHGRRFVEHQKLGIAHQAFHDLGTLSFAHRQFTDHGIGIEDEPEAVGDVTDAVAEFTTLQDALRLAQHQVLDHGHARNQAEVLVDHGDALIQRLGRTRRQPHLPAEPHLPGAGCIDSEDQVAQRRLAGAVLAQQALDGARLHVERNALQGLQATEALAEPVERQQRRWSRLIHRHCPRFRQGPRLRRRGL